jgi:hypothetical protein
MDRIEPSKSIKNWQGLVKLEREFADSREEWVFRGDAKHRTPKTTLQRACEQFDIAGQDIPQVERLLIREFQRVYPIYARDQVPETGDIIHWLSLMRHFGAPTRFLDFTFSMLIAAFFALETPIEAQNSAKYESAAIWAISKTWLTKHAQRQMREFKSPDLRKDWDARLGSAFETIFWNQSPALKAVFAVNPLRLHERLHVQQGLFLCPGDVAISFERNLLALCGWEKSVRVFLIEDSCRRDVLWKLGRAGLSRESLFPGLEGFAESLRVFGPLLFQRYKKLERTGGRIPTNGRNEFQYNRFNIKVD